MQFDQMRKQGASIFVYLIFCLLIAIFVINFRPGQSRQGDNGCSGTSNSAMKVAGEDITLTAYKIAYSNPYNRGTGKQKVYVALETLIRRELLAADAEARGLMVDDDLMNAEIRKGYYFLGGQRTMIPGIFDEDKDVWNLKAYKNWVGQLNVSPNSYLEEQKRSLLASMMAEILTESVQVSREEALSRFLTEGNTATYDVVAFKPETYRAAMRIGDADVDRYLAAHTDEVQARYNADKRTYKLEHPQLKLREIFIAKLEPEAKPETPVEKPAEPPTGAGSAAGSAAGSGAGSAAGSGAVPDKKADDKKADDKKAGDKKAGDKKADKPKPVGMPIAEAQAKLEAVRKAAASNKQKFIDAAKELNTDEAIKSVAGDIGWQTAESATLGDKAVNDAIKTLKPGEMTPVIATDHGVYLVMAEDKREGELTFDQVKREIALSLAKELWSKEAAKRAAISALDQARNGVGMNLEQLYDKDPGAPQQNPGLDIEQLLNDPNIPPEQKQKLKEMIEKNRHGSLEVQEKDHPAGWFEADSGAPATPAPANGSAAPALGGAGAGAGAGAPAPAGAGSGSAAIPVPPAKPAVDPLLPTKDPLPPMATVEKAHVNRFGPSAKGKSMPGLGQSKEAIAAVFDELQPGNLAKQIYEAEGQYIVIQLVARAQPNIADFDKDADRRVAELRQQRAQTFLEEWLKSKCEALAKDNKIRPNAELLIERDEQGKILPVGYKPCMSFR